MVKSKEQKKARREERAWNTWLWGAKGNAIWDESGCKALRVDQALRQRARAAAANVSQVESEQFAWQAGRWGHHPSAPSTDSDLLKAAIMSLGKCTLRDMQTENSFTVDSDSRSQSSGDEAEAEAQALKKDVGVTESAGSKERVSSSECTDAQDFRKCGWRGNQGGEYQEGGQSPTCRAATDCCYRSNVCKSQVTREEKSSRLTSRATWPQSAFGAQRSVLCSCLRNCQMAGNFREDMRRKRQGNLSPVDRVSDDVLMRIFAKLSRREVIAISPVCRRWRDVASCEPVWRHVELVSVAESLGDKELGLLAEKRLKHTTVLSIALCWRITSESLVPLTMSQCGRQLLCLDLSFSNVDESVVNAVAENCSLLQRLRLFGCRDAVSGQALARLANLSQLREIDLGLCVNVSQHTLKEIGSKLKLLVILSIAGCPRVTMANLLYLCGCSSLEALCLVGCKSIYTNQASEIAKELITGGCTRLAMVEAGNQLPNAAPFPARPPPPPPALVPAHGVAFSQSGSPTSSPTHRDAEPHAKICAAVPAAVEISNRHTKDAVYFKESIHGTRTEIEIQKPMERQEGDPQMAYAAASQRFQQGQTEFSDGTMEAATSSFRAACHFNPSAAAYTFMAWMQRLVGAERSECIRECARAIYLDNDYGNPWNDVACELWDAGDTSLAARFFQRAKACSRYEVGAGHLPYLNLAKLRLSESPNVFDHDGLFLDKRIHDAPSKEALLELCAALIRAPGDEVVQQMVFHMLDGLKSSEHCTHTVRQQSCLV